MENIYAHLLSIVIIIGRGEAAYQAITIDPSVEPYYCAMIMERDTNGNHSSTIDGAEQILPEYHSPSSFFLFQATPTSPD